MAIGDFLRGLIVGGLPPIEAGAGSILQGLQQQWQNMMRWAQLQQQRRQQELQNLMTLAYMKQQQEEAEAMRQLRELDRQLKIISLKQAAIDKARSFASSNLDKQLKALDPSSSRDRTLLDLPPEAILKRYKDAEEAKNKVVNSIVEAASATIDNFPYFTPEEKQEQKEILRELVSSRYDTFLNNLFPTLATIAQHRQKEEDAKTAMNIFASAMPKLYSVIQAWVNNTPLKDRKAKIGEVKNKYLKAIEELVEGANITDPKIKESTKTLLATTWDLWEPILTSPTLREENLNRQYQIALRRLNIYQQGMQSLVNVRRATLNLLGARLALLPREEAIREANTLSTILSRIDSMERWATSSEEQQAIAQLKMIIQPHLLDVLNEIYTGGGAVPFAPQLPQAGGAPTPTSQPQVNIGASLPSMEERSQLLPLNPTVSQRNEYVLNPYTETVKPVETPPKLVYEYGKQRVEIPTPPFGADYVIYDTHNNIWIAQEGNKIAVLKPESKQWEVFISDPTIQPHPTKPSPKLDKKYQAVQHHIAQPPVAEPVQHSTSWQIPQYRMSSALIKEIKLQSQKPQGALGNAVAWVQHYRRYGITIPADTPLGASDVAEPFTLVNMDLTYQKFKGVKYSMEKRGQPGYHDCSSFAAAWFNTFLSPIYGYSIPTYYTTVSFATSPYYIDMLHTYSLFNPYKGITSDQHLQTGDVLLVKWYGKKGAGSQHALVVLGAVKLVDSQGKPYNDYVLAEMSSSRNLYYTTVRELLQNIKGKGMVFAVMRPLPASLNPQQFAGARWKDETALNKFLDSIDNNTAFRGLQERIKHEKLLKMSSNPPTADVLMQDLMFQTYPPDVLKKLVQVSEINRQTAKLIAQTIITMPLPQQGGLTLGAFVNTLSEPTKALDVIADTLLKNRRFQALLNGLGIPFNAVYTAIIEGLRDEKLAGTKSTLPRYAHIRQEIHQKFNSNPILRKYYGDIQQAVATMLPDLQMLIEKPGLWKFVKSALRTARGFALFPVQVAINLYEAGANAYLQNLIRGKGTARSIWEMIKAGGKVGLDTAKGIGEFILEGILPLSLGASELVLKIGNKFGIVSPERLKELEPFGTYMYYRVLNDPVGVVAQQAIAWSSVLGGIETIGRTFARLPAEIRTFNHLRALDPQFKQMLFDRTTTPEVSKFKLIRDYLKDAHNPARDLSRTDKMAEEILKQRYPEYIRARKIVDDYLKASTEEKAHAILSEALDPQRPDAIPAEDVARAFFERLGIHTPTDILLFKLSDLIPSTIEEIFRRPVQSAYEKTLHSLAWFTQQLDQLSQAKLVGWGFKRLAWATETTAKILDNLVAPEDFIGRLTDKMWDGILRGLTIIATRFPILGKAIRAVADYLSPTATVWQALRSYAWRVVFHDLKPIGEEFVKNAEPLLQSISQTLKENFELLKDKDYPYLRYLWSFEGDKMVFNDAFVNQIFNHKILAETAVRAPTLREVLRRELKLPDEIVDKIATETNEALFRNVRTLYRRMLDRRNYWVEDITKGVWTFSTRQMKRAQMQDSVIAKMFLNEELQKAWDAIFGTGVIPISQMPEVVFAADLVGTFGFISKALRKKVWDTNFPDEMKIQAVQSIQNSLAHLLREYLYALDLRDDTIDVLINDFIFAQHDEPTSFVFNYFDNEELNAMYLPLYEALKQRMKEQKRPVPEEITEEMVNVVHRAIQSTVDELLRTYYENNEEALRVIGNSLDNYIKDNNIKLTEKQIQDILRMVGSVYLPHPSPEVIEAALSRLQFKSTRAGIRMSTGGLLRASNIAALTPLERAREFGHFVSASPRELIGVIMDNTADIFSRVVATEYICRYLGKEISWDEVQNLLKEAEENPDAPQPLIIAIEKRARKMSLEEIMEREEREFKVRSEYAELQRERATRELEGPPEEEEMLEPDALDRVMEEEYRKMHDREIEMAAERSIRALTDFQYIGGRVLNIDWSDERVREMYELTEGEVNALQYLAREFRADVRNNPQEYTFIAVDPVRFVQFSKTIREIRELGRGTKLLYTALRAWRNLWAGPLLSLPPFVLPWIIANVYTNILFGIMFGINPFSILVRIFKKSKLSSTEKAHQLLETFALEGLTPMIEPPQFFETETTANIKSKLGKLGDAFAKIWDTALIGTKVNSKVEVFFRENYAYELAKRFLNRPDMRDTVLRTVMRREGLEGILGHIADINSLTATLEEVLAMPHFPEKQVLLNAVRDELGRVINHYVLSTPVERWLTVSLFPFWKYYRHATTLLLTYPLRHPDYAMWLYALGDWADHRIDYIQMAKRNKALAKYITLTAPDLLFINPAVSIVKPSDLSFWQKEFTLVVDPEDSGKMKVLFATRLFPFLFAGQILKPESDLAVSLANAFLMLSSPWWTLAGEIFGSPSPFGTPYFPLAVPPTASMRPQDITSQVVSLLLPTVALTMSDRWVFFESGTNRAYIIDFNKGTVQITTHKAWFYRALQALHRAGVIPLTASIQNALTNMAQFLHNNDLLVPEWLIPYLGAVPKNITERRHMRIEDIFPFIGQVLLNFQSMMREELPGKHPFRVSTKTIPSFPFEELKEYTRATPQFTIVYERIKNYITNLQRNYGYEVSDLLKKLDTLIQAPSRR